MNFNPEDLERIRQKSAERLKQLVIGIENQTKVKIPAASYEIFEFIYQSGLRDGLMIFSEESLRMAADDTQRPN